MQRSVAMNQQQQGRGRPQASKHVNILRFIIFQKLALQVFYEEGKTFNTFVRAQGFTQHVRNTVCKQKTCFVQEISTGHL